MADTKLGRNLPGEGSDTPLPVRPMSDFTGYGIDDPDDLVEGYCDFPPDTSNPDTRTGGICTGPFGVGLPMIDDEEPGFLYRGRLALDR